MVYNFHNQMVKIPSQSRLIRSSARISARLVLLLVLGWGWLGQPVRGDDQSFASVAKSYLERAVGTAKNLFGGKKEASPPANVDPDEAAREKALADAKAAIFYEKDGSCFTQSRWGASPAPYQIGGLQFVAIPESIANAADGVSGIDRRITYQIRAARFRVYEASKGWGPWQNGAPPHLDSITLVRERGVWKVSVSPLWAYSLR